VQRAATVFPQRTAVVQLTEDEERIFTWAESFGRCKRLASALSRHGVGKGDVVAVMLPNVPEMFESHNGVPMCGGILNSINTRLDAPTIAYILEHSGAKVTGLPFIDSSPLL
jgi:fatty-acyl-CoA synthase